MQDVDVPIVVLGAGNVEAAVLADGLPQELVLDPWEVGLRAAIVDVVLNAVGEDGRRAVIRDAHHQVVRLQG